MCECADIDVEWRESKDSAHLTTTSSSSITILYRTMPRYDSHLALGKRMMLKDQLLRPDLRLGRSDPGIRKVAEVAKWFAEWMEGEPPE